MNNRKKPEEFTSKVKYKNTKFVYKIFTRLSYISIGFLLFYLLFIISLFEFPINGSLLGFCITAPKEESGKLLETYQPLDVDIYVVDSPAHKVKFSDQEIHTIFNDINSIWNNYNITFKIRKLERRTILDSLAYVNPSDVNEVYSLTKFVINNDSLINDTVIDIIFVEKFKQDFLIETFGRPSEGQTWRGLDNVVINNIGNLSVYLVVLTQQGKNISWNLAHEMGHIFGHGGHFIPDVEYNLMTNGCNKEKHPILLNQKQINVAKGVIEEIIKRYELTD